MQHFRSEALLAYDGDPVQGTLKVSMSFLGPSKPRGDLGNLIGGVEDALNGVLWEDDAQIEEYGEMKRWVPSEEWVTLIMVEVIPAPVPLPKPKKARKTNAK